MPPMHHNAAQPQQPVNPRPQAQFPTPNAPPQAQQRQHPTRVTLPPQRKKILSIVDPDTKKEVKVNKVSSMPSTTVKIPARRRLIVVDPKDYPSKSPESDMADVPADAISDKATEEPRDTTPPDVVHQPAMLPGNSTTTNGDTQAATVSTSITHTSGATTQPSATTGHATLPPTDAADVKHAGPRIERISSAENDSDALPASVVPTPKDVEPVDASDVSSSTFADVQSDSADNSQPHTVQHMDAKSESSAADTLPHAYPRNDSLSDARSLSETVSDDTQSSHRNGMSSVPTTNPSMDTSGKPIVATGDSPLPSQIDSALPSTQEHSVEGSMGTPDESTEVVADNFPRFDHGERRVYPVAMFNSMKKLMILKRAAEFEAKLGPLLKSAQRSQDPRAGRPVRSRTGPLGDASSRTFPPSLSSNFNVPIRGAPPPGVLSGTFGPNDQFDLSHARQNPPPAFRQSSSSGREGDPRGTRTMGPPRNRMDHMRNNSLDQFMPPAPPAPVEKLKRSDKGWKRNKEADDEMTAKVKQVRSLLNKLTLEKFEKIFQQIVDIDVSSLETLTGVVQEIFEKTLFEPKFSNMYAELCRRLDITIQPVLDRKQEQAGKQLNFKKILLNHCKDEFTRFANSSNERSDDGTAEGDNATDGDADQEGKSPKQKKSKEVLNEEAMKASKAKKRMLANVRFIGELFLKDLLREQIIHRNCIQKLLSLGIEKKEEDVLEALCKLIAKTGSKLSENREAVRHIDTYFRHLEHFSRDQTLPARIRFMVQDLIEQRHNNWKVRREEAKAKTIAEIHQDIEKEERAKQEAQAQLKERRSRGPGGMHGRDRGGSNFPPRVHMTMAMNKPSSTGVSRSTAMMEKYSSRAGAGSAISGLQSMRLGPGGSKGVPGGGGLTSLRPNGGGSRFNVLSGPHSNDNRDPTAPVPTSDPRRVKSTKSMSTQRRTAVKPEPEAPQEKILDPKELRNLVQRKLKYYWLEQDLQDTLEMIDKEFPEPNHLAFVKESLKQSFEAKTAEAELSQDVFKGLVGTVINPKYFVTAFTEMVALAPDMEMDNPRVLEFLGKYIGCCASTKKLCLDGSSDLGLGFLKNPFEEYSDKKRACKLVVQVFSSTFKHMSTVVPNEDERRSILKEAFVATDVDLASAMKSWNFMRGLSVLSDMLKDVGMLFLVPSLDTEIQLSEVLEGGPTLESVSAALSKYGAAPSGSGANELMRVVMRVSFEWLLQSSGDGKEKFRATVSKALLNYYGGSIPRDVQMAAVLGVQEYFAKNQDTIPPTFENEKAAVAAFHVLYDSDIADEDTLLQWKDDTELSTKVVGKEKMLTDSLRFFTWLAEADEEE